MTFSLGVIFATFSYGLYYLIIYLIAYEAIYSYFTQMRDPYWRGFFRLAIVATAIFAWIFGRTISGWKDPLGDE